MLGIEKAVLGAFGGLSAVLVKFLGQDYANVVAHAANLTADQIYEYKLGYGLLTPILMFLGAFVAWCSDEQKRMKVVALAVAAPAMITTWSGGVKEDSPHAVQAYLVPSAYAQSSAPASGNRVNPEAITKEGAVTRIQSSIGVFFGYGKQPQKYWVIVGSYKERNDAQRFADKINAEDKTLNAWVGVKLSGNDYFPVIVGNYALLSEANELKRKALETDSIQDAYFSTGERP